jgi:hypothetical protein
VGNVGRADAQGVAHGIESNCHHVAWAASLNDQDFDGSEKWRDD